jgi:putative nucleotidyltransferase with HDIG domain
MTVRIGALVLAAGLSSRMDGFKPLMPLRDSTVLGWVTRTLRKAGVEDILVVAGHKAGEVYAEAARLSINCVINRDFEQGMFSSVLTGIASLPPDIDALLVLPVDIPLVRFQTIRALAERFEDLPVLYPTFLGERGHPPIIASQCLPYILAWSGDGGLRGALQDMEKILGADELPVADANILFDLDTPMDYREALRRIRRLGRPTPEEARALLEIVCVNERGLAHARAVARISLALAAALNDTRGWPLDMDLTESAALLHDIAKKRKNHEAEGGRLLDSFGFPDAARIVEAHRDISIPDIVPITEREVVYLADKLVSGDSPISIHRRFQEKLDRFGHDPQAFSAISGRRDRALAMLKRVERETGMLLKDILERAGLYYPTHDTISV